MHFWSSGAQSPYGDCAEELLAGVSKEELEVVSFAEEPGSAAEEVGTVAEETGSTADDVGVAEEETCSAVEELLGTGREVEETPEEI